MAKPTFSILSMLLLTAVVGLVFALVSTNRTLQSARAEMAELEKMNDYWRAELGLFDPNEMEQMRIRPMDCELPLARKFRIDFPHGEYHLCWGNFLGGEFTKENIEYHARSTLFFKMPATLVIDLYRGHKGVTSCWAKTVDFISGQVGGGELRHRINFQKAGSSLEQHDIVATRRITTGKPHGDVVSYPGGADFIPLFIFDDGVTLQDDSGNDVETKGIAFWFEPKRYEKK